ncbi:hypothetical protein JCM3765_003766 [Sporobolomyces pararoseus]
MLDPDPFDPLAQSNPERYLEFVKQHLRDLSIGRNLSGAQGSVLEAINGRCHEIIHLVEIRLKIIRTSLQDARSECEGSYLQHKEVVKSQLNFLNKLGSAQDPLPSFLANWLKIHELAVEIEKHATRKDEESEKQRKRRPLEKRHAMEVAQLYSARSVNDELQPLQDLEQARRSILEADLEDIQRSFAGRPLAAVESWLEMVKTALDVKFSTVYTNEVDFERIRDLLAVVRQYSNSRTEVVDGRPEMLPQFEVERLLSLWLEPRGENHIQEAHLRPHITDPYLLPPANYHESLPFFAKMHRLFTQSHNISMSIPSSASQHSLQHYHRFTSRQFGIYRLGDRNCEW